MKLYYTLLCYALLLCPILSHIVLIALNGNVRYNTLVSSKCSSYWCRLLYFKNGCCIICLPNWRRPGAFCKDPQKNWHVTLLQALCLCKPGLLSCHVGGVTMLWYKLAKLHLLRMQTFYQSDANHAIKPKVSVVKYASWERVKFLKQSATGNKCPVSEGAYKSKVVATWVTWDIREFHGNICRRTLDNTSLEAA